MRILHHVIAQFLQGTKRLIANFASQHGANVATRGTSTGTTVVSAAVRPGSTTRLYPSVATAAGDTCANPGGPRGVTALALVGRFPRYYLLLGDDVGVVLRLLHVRGHLGERAEALSAPHALEYLPRLLGPLT